MEGLNKYLFNKKSFKDKYNLFIKVLKCLNMLNII